MDIHNQLELQLKENIKHRIIPTPCYEEYWDNADDEMLKDVDMIRFTADAVYSKTQFACLSNDLNYEEKPYENIKLIDEFINKTSIVNVILSLGKESEGNYIYHEETSEWLFMVRFPITGLVALIDKNTIQIREEDC